MHMFQNLYPHLLAFHGWFSWVVLAAAVAAIFVALSGWSGTKPAGGNLLRFGILFVIAMDLEFLTGVALYFNTHLNMHAALMLLAVVCAHGGGALSRKGGTDLMKYRGAAIAYALSLFLMLGGIPR